MLLWSVIWLYHHSPGSVCSLLSVGTQRLHVCVRANTGRVFGCGWTTSVHCVLWLVWVKAMAANIVVRSDGCVRDLSANIHATLSYMVQCIVSTRNISANPHL